MQLYLPTKIYSETECVKNHAKELASYGRKAMIITGKHSSRVNGSLADVEAALQQEGVEYIIFDEIEENPSVETVMTARTVGLQEQIDFVIGIGGGSPLDASKAIAMMIANPLETEAVLYEAKELETLPIVCVPTTCGTGSEVTPYSILTLHKQRTKKSISHRIFPQLALMDAKYLKTMSRAGLVNTAVDALAHLIESYLNTNSNELNRIYSREGLRMWSEFKTRLQDDSLEEVDYTKLLHASMVGGMAITYTGTSLPHGLSYPVTYELGVPHGKAVGMFLGGYVACYEDRQESAEVLRLLGFADAKEFGCYLRDLLGEVEVSKELMRADVESILDNPAKLKNYPFSINESQLLKMANYI